MSEEEKIDRHLIFREMFLLSAQEQDCKQRNLVQAISVRRVEEDDPDSSYLSSYYSVSEKLSASGHFLCFENLHAIEGFIAFLDKAAMVK